jgi:hypothetical protein
MNRAAGHDLAAEPGRKCRSAWRREVRLAKPRTSGKTRPRAIHRARMRLAGGRAPDLCVSAFQFFASLKAIDRARNFFSVGAVRLPEIGEAGGERVVD